ncbi:hypothetical protein [Rhizobium sp. 18065]|uniref:DUF6894 family protein n=1 Tax=Rhizobium sp. 18065 TaxID=2681411 RepID=UPI0013599947|nr:hypothetical protein [Rhizobium sp. 18065]
MAKYFFDLLNGDGFFKDIEGRDLFDRASVHKEVALILLDIAGDEMDGVHPFDAKITVRDQKNATLLTGSLSFRVD